MCSTKTSEWVHFRSFEDFKWLLTKNCWPRIQRQESVGLGTLAHSHQLSTRFIDKFFPLKIRSEVLIQNGSSRPDDRNQIWTITILKNWVHTVLSIHAASFQQCSWPISLLLKFCVKLDYYLLFKKGSRRYLQLVSDCCNFSITITHLVIRFRSAVSKSSLFH